MRIVKIAGIIFASICALLALLFYLNYDKMERGYQKAADEIRLEHLVYWTGLIEEFYEETGKYPLQDSFTGTEEIGLVRIVSDDQRRFFNPLSESYRSEFDNNWNNRFAQIPLTDFISVLQNGLDRDIVAKFDFQKIPMRSTIGYNYFVADDGYLLWVTCISCGVTQISTLLMDGLTPTVNIASIGMVPYAYKAFTRQEMLEHPLFQSWQAGEWETP